MDVLALLDLSVFPPHPGIPLRHLCHPPHGDSNHGVGENGKEWGCGLGVVSPAQPGGAPQFEEVGEFRIMAENYTPYF